MLKRQKINHFNKIAISIESWNTQAFKNTRLECPPRVQNYFKASQIPRIYLLLSIQHVAARIYEDSFLNTTIFVNIFD